MNRPIVVVGAPSSLGIRPYDDGPARHLDRAPGVMRQRGLVSALEALDMGDVSPPPYRDYVRPPDGARNEAQVLAYSRSLGRRVEAARRLRHFTLVLGGDCSIVLGCLLGARRAARGSIGLVYVDAHADFATPEESSTGSVASMALALASGRGETPLAHLFGGRAPLVESRHIALIGRRDAGQAWYGHAALAASPILDLPDSEVRSRTPRAVAAAALERVATTDVRGFWIHVDADVLNPSVMHAVDSPQAGGPAPEELLSILTPLVCHPYALGMNVTIYDPALDPDRSCARRLVQMLETLLAPEDGERRAADWRALSMPGV
jgi:arginase